MPDSQIRFGWYIPTHGDLTNFADPDQFIPASMEMFERVALAAELAGFEYALVPVTLDLLGGLDFYGDDVGQDDQTEDARGGAPGIHFADPDGADDRSLRPALGGPGVHQPDRRR